ncbi:MAG: hypothetical protein P8K68_14030 [Algibacter sp.]|uniref:hypothetical protein n=1 Tax=Algibacter sp. TaxID=1872428 RepID=UPI00261EC47D|nr:hypothetical protein [Algibacter sp.]MDG1730977.1 hypothetical protein [Algibacter sp.]MDG2179884.1 hypothetical protein [Algibacter sp.]
MIETFELRDKPELKITLSESGIEISDASQPKNNGIFLFNTIKSIELNNKKTNWFITIFSWIMYLFASELDNK